MDTDRLDELFDRHLDGALTAADEAELASLLADLEGRRRWRALSALEGKLLEEHMAVPAARPARGLLAARWRRLGGDRSRAGLIAAAALVGIGILLVFLASGRSRPVQAPTEVAKKDARRPEDVKEPPSRKEPPPPADESKLVPPPPDAPPPVPPERPEAPPPGEEPPPPRPEEPAPPRREPVGETVAAVAVLERVEGKNSLRAGQGILPGRGIETSPGDGLAVVMFPDGTRLEAGPDTLLREIAGDPKRVVLDRGTLSAKVVRQPAGRPLVVDTPHAEARVLGTALRLSVDAAGTRLDVSEGKVRLTRKADGKFLEVPAGYCAAVGPGADFASRPMPPRPAVLSFTLIDADAGRPVAGFDPIREGAVINLSRLPTRRLNIRANTSPAKVGSVRFGLDRNPGYRVENGLSGTLYSLAGDMNGIFNAWTPSPGPHTVTATPYTEQDAKGSAGIPLTLTFRVVKE